MSPRTKALLAGLTLGLCLLSWLVVGVLVFYLPQWEKMLDDFGTVLPPWQTEMFFLSNWITGRAYANQTVPGLVLVGPLLLASTAAALIWSVRTTRRKNWHLEGRCRACGYDLRGNPAGPCPECGAPAVNV